MIQWVDSSPYVPSSCLKVFILSLLIKYIIVYLMAKVKAHESRRKALQFVVLLHSTTIKLVHR